MNSLDFVGHVVLIVSPPLEKHQESQEDEEEEDESQHRAHRCADDHSHFTGWKNGAHSDHMSPKKKSTQHRCWTWGWIFGCTPDKQETAVWLKHSSVSIKSILSRMLLCVTYSWRYPGWWRRFLCRLNCWPCTCTSRTCCCSGCSASECRSSHLKQQDSYGQALVHSVRSRPKTLCAQFTFQISTLRIRIHL